MQCSQTLSVISSTDWEKNHWSNETSPAFWVWARFEGSIFILPNTARSWYSVEADQGALETGQGALEVGQGALEAGQGALKTGQWALEAGQGSLKAGQGAQEAGKGALEDGQQAFETGQQTLKLVSGCAAIRWGRIASRKGCTESIRGRAVSSTG